MFVKKNQLKEMDRIFDPSGHILERLSMHAI